MGDYYFFQGLWICELNWFGFLKKLRISVYVCTTLFNFQIEKKKGVTVFFQPASTYTIFIIGNILFIGWRSSHTGGSEQSTDCCRDPWPGIRNLRMYRQYERNDPKKEVSVSGVPRVNKQMASSGCSLSDSRWTTCSRLVNNRGHRESALRSAQSQWQAPFPRLSGVRAAAITALNNDCLNQSLAVRRGFTLPPWPDLYLFNASPASTPALLVGLSLTCLPDSSTILPCRKLPSAMLSQSATLRLQQNVFVPTFWIFHLFLLKEIKILTLPVISFHDENQ